MNKYAIVGMILGTVVIIAGLAWFSQPKTQIGNQANNQPPKASVLKSDSTLFDFGTISMAKGKVSHQFQIMNNSNNPIRVNKIYTSCMCTTARFELDGKKYGTFAMESMGGLTAVDVTINPGRSGILEAIYDPAAHGPAGVGPIDRFVSMRDINGGILEMEIKAVVTP